MDIGDCWGCLILGSGGDGLQRSVGLALPQGRGVEIL